MNYRKQRHPVHVKEQSRSDEVQAGDTGPLSEAIFPGYDETLMLRGNRKQGCLKSNNY